jgi:hypothetical protein
MFARSFTLISDVLTTYNFCRLHSSLTSDECQPQTPAMAAGITDHAWSVSEFLH